MIKNIGSGITGGYLHVTDNHTSLPYISPNSSNPLQGMVRLINQNLEVFDGNCWQMLNGGYPSVHLDQRAIDALDWCHRKMIEEQKIRQLAEKSVTVAEALKTYELAKEQLNVVLALTQEAENVT